MANSTKFIRVHGRIVPIRGKGSAPAKAGISKRYGAKKEAPPVHKFGIVNGAALGAAAAGLATMKKSSELVRVVGYMGVPMSGIAKKVSLKFNGKHMMLGAAAGAILGSLKFTKRAKGESSKQLADRLAKKK